MLSSGERNSLREYVAKHLPASKTADARLRAGLFLSEGLIWPRGYDPVEFNDGAMWEVETNRSLQRALHGFLFFGDWCGTILADKPISRNAILAVERIIHVWTEKFGHRDGAHGMAYHDETTAQRLIHLLALDATIGGVSDTLDSTLSSLSVDTVQLLASDEFHSTGNNHGMFQDIAVLYWVAMTSHPDLEGRHQEFFDRSMRRLRDYFDSSFTTEGVHKENTPTYHVMVAKNMGIVRDIARLTAHPDANSYDALLHRAEEYAYHAIMPTGEYPPISDTHARPVSGTGAHRVFSSSEFLYASSGGSAGSKPNERILVLPESGYAIYRSSWASRDASFLFFTAAYNADYHKHSDDLSIFLMSSGVELLADAGPYSYDYKNPLSRYAYSQYAHNGLIVDGRSLPRTDKRAHRVALRDIEQRADGFTVIGTNARHDDVRHERGVEIREYDGLPVVLVSDVIAASNHHDYSLLWNIGTEVDVLLHGQGFELFREGAKVLDLSISADRATRLSLHEGEMKPKPLGWRFPQFGKAVPSKVVVIKFEGRNARIDTSINLTNFTYGDQDAKGRHQSWSRFEDEVSLNYLFVPAQSDQGRRRLVVVFSAIGQRGNFTYNYKATIDQVDISALYIIDDFGDQGSYYHSDHRSEAIFRSVQNLIAEICRQRNIDPGRVAMTGSSKGGAAALMHGAKFGAGRIIAGAPQTRIGSFLEKPHPNIVRFMAGGESEQDIEHLDSILFEKLEELGTSTKILLLVGQNDHHLPNHVSPLMDFMRERERHLPSLTVLPELSHADIGGVFRHFLSANLEQFVAETDEEALPYILTPGSEAGSIRIKVYSPQDRELSYRLFSRNDLLIRRGFSTKEVAVFSDLPPGQYRIRVYSRESGSTSATAFTTRWITL